MGRRWALSSVAAWCAFLASDDFAAGPDRLYFLFTGGEKSELKAFDFTGRLVGGVKLKSRASRIAPACAHGGVLVIRPRT